MLPLGAAGWGGRSVPACAQAHACGWWPCGLRPADKGCSGHETLWRLERVWLQLLWFMGWKGWWNLGVIAAKSGCVSCAPLSPCSRCLEQTVRCLQCSSVMHRLQTVLVETSSQGSRNQTLGILEGKKSVITYCRHKKGQCLTYC